MSDQAFTTPADFCRQLLSQLYGDLDRLLSETAGTEPVANAYGAVTAAAAAGEPRGASFYVLVQAALAAHHSLVGGESELELPDAGMIGQTLVRLVPAAQPQLASLAKFAARLVRYTDEAEPAGRTLPVALALAIYQLYEGLLNGDQALGKRGLVSLRTLLAHCDAVSTQLAVDAEDRPIRVFPPDRFHDYFMMLTEQVQKASGEAERPVAALTRDGRLTALIAESDHPMQEAAAAIRDSVAGDPTTKEHALLRMQGLLRVLEEARHLSTHPLAEALTDDAHYLSLVTAAATAPMVAPGRFGLSQLTQISRYNYNLIKGSYGKAERSSIQAVN